MDRAHLSVHPSLPAALRDFSRAEPPLAADGLINAAGFSERMGCWKMMLPFGEGALLDASLINALTVCERVVVVAGPGPRGECVASRYAGLPMVETFINPEAEKGLFSSIQRGLREVERAYVFIAHGDMPFIAPGVFRALWQARGEWAALPTFAGKNGHPVLLPKKMARQLACAPAQTSAKEWLLHQRHRFVPLADPGILFDVDTPEDYRRALEMR